MHICARSAGAQALGSVRTVRWELRAGAEWAGSPGKGRAPLRTCPGGWCFGDSAALLHLHNARSRALLAQREPARPLPQRAVQLAHSPACSAASVSQPLPRPRVLPGGGAA